MFKLASLIALPLLTVPALARGVDGQASTQISQSRDAGRLSAERLASVNQLLQSYVDQGRIAGAVVQIQQDGRTVFSTAIGWRDKEARAPMRQETIFRIASQTKALTSVAVMMLLEDGKLLLNDPVGKHLPEWSSTKVAVPTSNGRYDVVPAKRPITIRDLLTHTAGVSYGSGPAEKAWRDAGFLGWYWADRKEPVASAVARMAALPMAAQPGEQFVYGYGTDILGVVVEKLSGMTLNAFLSERLIRPLGMKDTSFYAPREKAKRLAVVYSVGAGSISRAGDPGEWKDGGFPGQGQYVDGPRTAFSGGAGLLSTAADYSRFLEMLRRGGELDGRRYLSRKSVELMTSDHLVEVPYSPGKGFGLGFSIRTDVGRAGELGSVGEFGWGGAYHSTYWVDPRERITVVYMTQLLPAESIDDHGKLRALIYQALQ
ncbi:serine hydrolase domain-containing protein [uncultured Sphingomonas sp.]|uniref:serine hydrolase domain-containing protein n=1 Tax=uncultured Sphingomonas sp. TaxID=158754 RepID=UPI0035CA5D26